ncbi:hypothetical protein FACHB389_29285 [Nostoc calcicola FACHB-389]|nr:hypothetical protein [Nostoc calcicola FACHB-3891]OKH25702.1 hypothetical protein FACHB389_29285 [Nostoc calcicola FACHB-389]
MVDTCASLAAEIAALRAEIARIPKVDEGRIVQTTRAALQPDISTAVAAGGAVVINKLQPEISSAFRRGSDALQEAVKNTRELELTKAAINVVRGTATEAERIGVEAYRKAINGEYQDIETRRIANEAKNTANTANSTATSSLSEAKTATKTANDGIATANQANLNSGKAVNQSGTAISEAATATRTAVNAANDVSGLRGVVNGFGSKIDDLGRFIAKVESTAVNALFEAGKAVGISKEALSAYGRLAGRVLELANTIATIFTLIEQLAILKVLGSRIDAIEDQVLSLGGDLSRVLGKLLGLQNRIGAVEGIIPDIRRIAQDALSIGKSAEAIGKDARGEAKEAQRVADGALKLYVRLFLKCERN